ncbi:Sorting nexin MVP1 [Hondaea fermentalgiana]|uniref:Sorting nexin MVP1 n=1 Tax=Hondaea fermentalgiana TaxID=2315210 RepID=A0A2R5GH10_9STRA|nr:Sorting nexin MVP1 [Hondaea fermentalgiana]|eukprot:GBG27933.1 Sorting nexin MVP1 [Hondaea fermentalgiana]
MLFKLCYSCTDLTVAAAAADRESKAPHSSGGGGGGGGSSTFGAGDEEFWASHFAWRREAVADEIKVRVCDPVQGARTIMNPTPAFYFKVCAFEHEKESEVRRRFSEFEFLQEVLQKRYAGLVVPRLPEKRVVKTSSFLKERARELALFLSSLLRVPYFRADGTVQAFLTEANPHRWEAVKAKVAAYQPGTALDRNASDKNEGRARWLEAMQHFHLEQNAVLPFWEVLQHLSALSELLNSIMDAASRMVGAASEYTDALSDLADRVNRPKVLQLDGHLSESLRDAVGVLDDFVSQWSEASAPFPGMLVKNFYQVVRQELDDVVEMQRLLTRLQALERTILKLDENVQQHFQAQARAKNTGRVDQIPKLNEKITRVVYKKKLAETERDQIAKALLLTDMEHFVQRKTETLRNLGASFAVPFRSYLVQLEDLL